LSKIISTIETVLSNFLLQALSQLREKGSI